MNAGKKSEIIIITQQYRVSADTLLGGYSVYRLVTLRRGQQQWQRISNHPTYEAAKIAEKALP